jgi:hypothetical protein
MCRSLKVISLLIIAAMLSGTMLYMAGNAFGAQAVTGAVGEIRLSSERDFLFAYQPQDRLEDSVLVTAHLYDNGRPVKKSGIPVDFSLSDGRFAALDNERVYTDEWGTASTRVRTYNSGMALSDRPFLLTVMASAGGKSSQVTLPITHYMPLNGTVKDKGGAPVAGARVALLYNRTHVPVSAMGTTTVTDVNGKYKLERVPTEIGDLVIYVKQDGLETYTPASFPQPAG